MENLKDGEKLPDKEVVAVGSAENGTPATTSEGEYSEEQKQVMSAMKSHYGEDITPASENYTSKLEGMVATDLIPKAGRLKSYDEANTRLIAMMEDEPVLSDIMVDVGKGRKFMSAVKHHLDLNAIPEEDDTDTAAWEENDKMRMSRYNEKLARQKELADNEEKSLATLDEFASENKLEGESLMKFTQLVADFLDRAYSGDITKDFLQVMYNHMNRENDLSRERELGSIAAKNAKIKEEKFDANEYGGDGLPHPVGSGAMAETAAKDVDPVIASLNKHLDQGSVLGTR
jgi:hypothetical protein